MKNKSSQVKDLHVTNSMTFIDITLDIWKWQGAVFVGGSSADFKRLVKRDFDMDIETGSNAAAHAHVEYGKPWVIWVESLKNIPAIAHEALHIAGGVLEARGLKYNEGSEEAYTYTMEFILERTLTAKKWTTVR